MNILHRRPPLFTHDAHQRLRDLEAIIFAILKRTGPITIRNEELVALPHGKHVEMTSDKAVNGATFCGLTFEAVDETVKKGES